MTSPVLPSDRIGALSLDNQSPGRINGIQKNNAWTVDLNQIKIIIGDADFDISRVTMTDGGTLDNTTSIVNVTINYSTKGAKEMKRNGINMKAKRTRGATHKEVVI